MKNLELIEKSLKKNSTQQLFSKLGKLNQNSQDYEVIVSILEKRGQDVSNWKNESNIDLILDTVDESWADDGSDSKESDVIPEPINLTPTLRDKLIEEVDQFVDELIKSKRTGVYTEVMRALGGQYDSDIDELFETVSEEQLKDALSFKNLKQDKTEVKNEKKDVIKKVKENNKKSFTKSKEIEILESGISVSFIDRDKNSVNAKIVKFFLSHKNSSEICELVLGDNRLVHKRTNKLKILDEQ